MSKVYHMPMGMGIPLLALVTAVTKYPPMFPLHLTIKMESLFENKTERTGEPLPSGARGEPGWFG
jgi:hypothetical protein